ncbi:MAG: hypothetical protein ACK4NS_13375, partial [Saprospiraceae bacterium]
MKFAFTYFALSAILLLWHANAAFGQCNGAPCATPQPVMNAQNACVLPSPSALNCYVGATTADPPESFPPSWCSTIENNHWFAFIADAPTVNFTFEVFNCQGANCIQAAVMSSTDCINFQFAGPCVSGMSPGGQYNVPGNGLIPGEVYFLTIDGCAGALCDYSINGSGATIINPAPLVCMPTGPRVYTANNPAIWTINPPNAGNFIGPSTGTSVTIQWVQQGTAQLCVQSLSCPDGQNCVEIVVGQRETTLIEVLQCPGETVECSGNTYNLPGNYTINYQTYQGCDSIVTCRIKPVQIYNSPLFQINKCGPGASHEVCGTVYDISGGYQHTCTGWQGCDSIINFLLAIMEPQAIILSPAQLDCENNQTITLFGNQSPINPAQQAGIGGNTFYFWSGPGIVGFNNTPNIQVNQPGEYCLVVTHSRMGVFCRDTTCVTVTENKPLPPPPTISGNLSPCGAAAITYAASAPVNPAATFTWTVSGGIPFNQISPDSILVTWPNNFAGQICVTATNACGSSPQVCRPVNVLEGVLPPDFDGPASVCAAGGTYAYVLDSLQPGATYSWTAPNGATLDVSADTALVNFINAQSGQICVTAQNSCGTSPPACQAVQVSPPASVALSGGGQICDGQSVTLTFTAAGNGPFDVVWTDGAQNNTLTDINNGH